MKRLSGAIVFGLAMLLVTTNCATTAWDSHEGIYTFLPRDDTFSPPPQDRFGLGEIPHVGVTGFVGHKITITIYEAANGAEVLTTWKGLRMPRGSLSQPLGALGEGSYIATLLVDGVKQASTEFTIER